MKLALNIGSLAVVGLFSVSTLAQVAVRPRPATEVRPEVTVKPGAATRGQGLEGRYAAPKAGSQAQVCDKLGFSSAQAAGTRVPQPVVLAAYEAGILKGGKGDCKQSTTMGVPARENQNEAAECMLNKGAAKLAVNSPERANIGAGCLADAFNNDPGAAPTTAAAQATTFATLKNDCAYLQ
jgi:hypothetical protein